MKAEWNFHIYLGPTLPRQNAQLPPQVQNGPSQEDLEIQRRQVQFCIKQDCYDGV